MILVWLILIPFIAGLLSWQAELRFGPSKRPELDRSRIQGRLPIEGFA